MVPATSKPPRMRASTTAHGLSENRSGRPLSAQPTKDSMSTACMIRSVRVNRR
jgi:hypothetical protein